MHTTSAPVQASEGELYRRILQSRAELVNGWSCPREKAAEEGGCGVVGFAASVPVRGRHIFEPSIQMHNRGNGKGGGIAAACLVPEQFGVDRQTLNDDYLLQVALMDPSAESVVEESCISPNLTIHHRIKIKPPADYRDVGLEVKPPDIVQYFVRVKDNAITKFAGDHGLDKADRRSIEDEFMFRNSFQINRQYYASLGEKRAFVLSHGRNLLIFKIVGYAEQVVDYYGLTDLRAHIWIAHQRYPTKGRVWHPGGAHPFIGMNEALVHNGDFANYYSVVEYLRQHNLAPLFLTDTEVSVLLFDLLNRSYKYPLEYIIEAMAPTTEQDFDALPKDKKKIYRAIQALHMHGSPDGPWFFIIARSDPDREKYQLLGITDTSMLRPQVFAIQEGDVSIGLIASEKQAIDATLHSLAQEDSRFRLVADRYWNARGGSHTDGGAFVFTLDRNNGTAALSCADKFGTAIVAPAGKWRFGHDTPQAPGDASSWVDKIEAGLTAIHPSKLFGELRTHIAAWELDQIRWITSEVVKAASRSDRHFELALAVLTLLLDRRYDCGQNKRSAVLQILADGIRRLLDTVAPLTPGAGKGRYRRIDFGSRDSLRAPVDEEKVLVIFARDFQPEGEACDARLMVKAFHLGWKRFAVYALKGQRFTGCGFGPATGGVRIDVYGSSGDYLASGIDGMELHVHGNGQDQLGQILKSGTLVVHGDIGQAFMYGAKGGDVYIMGNAAGRPLINAAGRPRVVINGTCLDFLAESFMAGDPHNGGGFVILNGIEFDERGQVREQTSPYPGANLFSLASGGAIFVRDPHEKIGTEKLNGGAFSPITEKDWQLILPSLQANEHYFGISIEKDLLMVNGKPSSPMKVYRKVHPARLAVLAKTVMTDD